MKHRLCVLVLCCLQIPKRDLAEYFISKAEKENIVLEVFSLLELDCIARAYVDSEALDRHISDFQRSGHQDVQALAAVIEIIRDAKRRISEQDKELAEKVRAYLDAHYLEDLSVVQIAGLFHVSYYYLCHCFKSSTGVSVSEYRNRKRIAIINQRVLKELQRCLFNLYDIYLRSIIKKKVRKRFLKIRFSGKCTANILLCIFG